MDSKTFATDITRLARRLVAEGATSREIERRAAHEEADGFSVSAAYTRLLASTMRLVEREAEQTARA